MQHQATQARKGPPRKEVKEMGSMIFTPGPSRTTVRAADGRVLTVPEGWVLLPPGDAALTRGVKAAGEHWAVQERKGRKVFSRGVWAPAAFKATAKKLGVKVTEQYWTLGAFDGVIVCEAPEEVTATLLHLGTLGNIRTQTARAYDAAEMQKILGLLPK
jgi:uncharacterized protein with GYD domain